MRRAYMDNLRCGIVLLVILYHIVYLFNGLGLPSNVTVTGTPGADVFLYLPYPWFMAALFLLAGMSARYALEKTDVRSWFRGRVRKILVPSLAGIFLVGWVGGRVTFWYNPWMFGGNEEMIPGFVKALIFCLSGIGPLWFLHMLFFCVSVLLLLRKLDRGDRLWRAGGKCCKMWTLALLFFAVWLSSHVLNTPVIEVYRVGFYLLFFLIGYFVLSHEEAQETLKKHWLPLDITAVIFGAAYVICFWGQNYAALSCLKTPLANAYAWFGCLALLGTGKRWWDRETGFTRFMRDRSFGYYVLHYPFLSGMTCVIDMRFDLTFPMFYFILAALTLLLLPPCYELLSRTPVIRSLLLGKRRGRRPSGAGEEKGRAA